MNKSILPLRIEAPLLQYIMLKNLDSVKSTLEEDKSKASILDIDKKSPLHAAAFAGTKEIAEMLIMSGGCRLVNGKDNAWITPLHMACKRNNHEIVSVLLQYGADVFARTKNWQTPAHLAAANGSIDSLKVLLSPPGLSPHALNNEIPVKQAVRANLNMSDRSGQTCLHLAAYYGHEEMCRVLIEGGANITQGDKRNRTALHLAVYQRHQTIISLLTEKLSKDEINIKDKDGNTALHVVASILEKGEMTDFWDTNVWVKPSAIAQQLVEAGADMTITNNSGNTVLHTACLNSSSEILPLLLELSKDIDVAHLTKPNDSKPSSLVEIPNKYNQTPLHLASFIHESDIPLEIIDEKNCMDILLQEWKSLIEYKCDNEMTALHQSARMGSSRRVKALLKAGALVDSIDRFGRTPLHIAAKGGYWWSIEQLLKQGADCKLQDGHGRTPLHLSAIAGSLVSCQKLILGLSSLGSGIDSGYINSRDNEGMTCLHHCAYKGCLETLQFLIASGADVAVLDTYGRTPLHYASANSNISCVLSLVNQATNNVNARDKTGCTALHSAAAKDTDGRCVEYLLSHKANAWIPDIQGYTPLHYAAANGNVTATMSLIELESVENSVKESKVDIPQSFALYLAVAGGHEDALIVLLSRFGDTINNPPELTVFNAGRYMQSSRLTFNTNEVKNQLGKSVIFLGRSLLHVACQKGYSGIVQLLIDNGSNLFAKDVTGNMRTPLHYAASNGHEECVKILLNSTNESNCLMNLKTTSKNLNSKNKAPWVSGRTPLIEAACNGHSKVVNLLLKNGTFPDAKDKFGRTALYMAAATGKEECVETLIQWNADIRAVDKYGKTALHIAAMKGHVGILGQLIDKYREDWWDEFKDNSQLWSSLEDNDGFTPIQWAAYAGHESCVEILTLNNPEEIVSYFDTKQACSSSKKGRFFSPVHCAVFKERIQCLSLLLEHLGPQIVHHVDSRKRTPLHIGVMSNSLECCKILIDNGAQINARDFENRTPLMLASKSKNLSCVELLLSKNCDIDSTDVLGNTALHYSCEGNGSAANAILKSSQAINLDVSHQNRRGQTALHIAAARHMVDTCELLLINGASVTTTDNQGLNAMLAVATSDDAATCLTMFLEVFKIELQTGSSRNSDAIREARRSISSLGSSRLSDSSISSSRFSDASLMAPLDTAMITQHNYDRHPEPGSTIVRKRSLPILMEDVQKSVKTEIKTENKNIEAMSKDEVPPCIKSNLTTEDYESGSPIVRKRSLPILMKDVQKSVKTEIKTDNRNTEAMSMDKVAPCIKSDLTTED